MKISLQVFKGRFKYVEINELEDKLSKLTSQVLSILDGSKETVDDEIDTERLKRLFEE